MSHPPAQAFCSIKTQFENVGDALIIRELILLIASRVPITVDLSRCPPEFRKTLDIDGDGRVRVVTYGFPALMRAMFAARFAGVECTYFLIPGGLGGEKRPKAVAVARVFNGILRAMRLVGIRACQVGVSYERLGPRHNALLRSRTRLMHKHMVRDTMTRDYATERGLRVDGVLPDMAFNLFRKQPRPAPERRAIAFSFRTDKSAMQAAAVAEFIERTCRLAPKGTVFKFVSQVGRDDGFMRAIAEKMQLDGVGETQFVRCADDIDACQETYADCVTIYSNRLHALMLAISAGARPFALIDPAVDGKIEGIFADAGWGEAVHPMARTLSDDSLLATFAPGPQLSGHKQVAQLDEFFDALLAPARASV